MTVACSLLQPSGVSQGSSGPVDFPSGPRASPAASRGGQRKESVAPLVHWLTPVVGVFLGQEPTHN
jgi:hypothetical protein